MESFQLDLIVNQVRTHNDKNIGYAIRSVSQRYFGLQMDYLSYIDYDNSIWQSIRNLKPVVVDNPYGMIAGQFMNISKQLTLQERIKVVV